jgi:RNA polymerase sigma-70 factor (ECF subfamily)
MTAGAYPGDGFGGDGDAGMLMGVAYRMLGSMADAQDAVQDARLRWLALAESQREAISSPTAWMVTVVSRICLDVLGSARRRREQYVGDWLPEPVPDQAQWSSHAGQEATEDPAGRVALDESVSMAMLVVLETMSPAERVTFILHDVFAYTFVEIAEMVGRTPAACRQLATAARRKVRQQRRAAVSARQHEAVVMAFRRAWETGDIPGLMAVLDPEVTLVTDGGGVVHALPAPMTGAAAVAGFLAQTVKRQPGIRLTMTRVNGEPGVVAEHDDELLAVATFEVVDGRIGHVWAMRNPEKLTAWHTDQ